MTEREQLRYKVFSYALSLEPNTDRRRKLFTRIIRNLELSEEEYPLEVAEEDFEAEKYEVEHNINY